MAFGGMFLAGRGTQSRAGKRAPSCPLGQPITVQDLIHLARSRSQPYNNYNLLPYKIIRFVRSLSLVQSVALRQIRTEIIQFACRLVSSAAVFGDVTQRSPKETAAHIRTTFFSRNQPITVSVPFSRTFSRQIRPLKLVQSQNVFYLWEMSQMNIQISGFCLGTPKITGDA